MTAYQIVVVRSAYGYGGAAVEVIVGGISVGRLTFESRTESDVLVAMLTAGGARVVDTLAKEVPGVVV